MNTELIKNLRANADFATKQHDNFTLWSFGKQLNDAAAALEAADIALADCRNELCLKCGTYKTAHEGSCDGCRWKKGE